MKLLVLGGKGMAGHVMVEYFRTRSLYDVVYTHRNKSCTEGIYLNASDYTAVESLIAREKPNVLINCIGILNQFAEQNVQEAILVNSLLPHVLQNAMDKMNGRLIHISTDCVFEGEQGDYPEQATPDGQSMYAKTKFLGEIIKPPHLTVRTSIIGPELKDGIGLFQWFMKQTGQVNGYVNVFWNGVTTLELAKAVHHFIEENVSGLYHLTAPEKVSKYTLLKYIQDTFDRRDLSLVPFENAHCDRTLLNTREDVRYTVVPYEVMLQELRDWMDERDGG
ncbi:dTDP-4-dehydrorhamnose reductase family protein [Pseudalkalibacillus sp. Hm43]|uniref:dTDP-4-dehydrorhamnose reductase family protein n=1 Tax=Pseudalkalibacillus sp. Hm43 TaxID=3450742 RepID=UPI003F43B6C8